MGRLPSHIFVVRHGNRLDAADKQWHLTSPTPYDPPLTYGGFLQARQAGNQIGSILEQAKVDAEVTGNGAALSGKRRRFRVVIHSSPFLRCVQTSVGISSGLAQTAPDSIYQPCDVVVPRRAPVGRQSPHKSALLRLDTFLGEWLSPEYFEMITPPPGPALMMGGAKAELLRREDYSIYAGAAVPGASRPASKGALWSSPVSSPSQRPASPAPDQGGGGGSLFSSSAMAAALSSASQEQKKGYAPPRPLHAISSNGKIPDGFVAHARDSCVVVDYQWDSMRPPLDFGHGGTLGEEWTSMHHRFRSGLKRMLNWYATTDYPDELLCAPASNENDHSCSDSGYGEEEEEEVETVVVIVSHGAGCNALIGAVTHQPVLMDVGVASITLAARKPEADYAGALALASGRQGGGGGASVPPQAAVDDLYEIRLSASTEHLRSNSGASVAARPASPKNTWSPPGRRGRTPASAPAPASTSASTSASASASASTLASTLAGPPAVGGPVQSPFALLEPLSSVGSRSTSANPSVGHFSRRDSGSSRRSPRMAPPPTGTGYGFPSGNEGGSYAVGRGGVSSSGLWAPARSALRLIDDVDEEAVDDYDSMLPDFDNKRFRPISEENIKPSQGAKPSEPFPDLPPAMELPASPKGPIFAAPIKLNTDLAFGAPVEEMPLSHLGGLWNLAMPPSEADRLRDLSQTKRRWTVNERAR
ncbi:phosphoglycerate mutase family [Trichoderma cornu-damae]|uniref:Phosphoglycerate mutase family n=1 Tax=Trichoderma cornu-damae TaxID=654480 RepID=A0A9P8TTS7_9HYPO|nr:phosphoglycerate mutase family [Trichoderma cornu-damae]